MCPSFTYRKVVSVSGTTQGFQTVHEGEIWCLCTVTFGSKGPKLNSRLVYCSQLYGTSILVYSLLDKIWISGTALIYSNKKNSQFLCPKGKNCKPVEIKLLLFVGHMVILGCTLILRYIQSLTSKLNSTLLSWSHG